jgi:hypothetical protein
LLITISRTPPVPLRAEHPAVFSIRTCVNMQETTKHHKSLVLVFLTVCSKLQDGKHNIPRFAQYAKNAK